MNLKSNILKITIVFALIFMLVPVIAAADAADDASVQSVDEDTVLSEDLANDDLAASDDLAADDDLADDDDADEDVDDLADDEIDEDVDPEMDVAMASGGYPGSADLQITLISNAKHVKAGDLANFGIVVLNNGPDTANNVVIRFAFPSGDLYSLASQSTKGIYNMKLGVWYIDELAPGEIAALAFSALVLSNENILFAANVVSDTPDPDLSNNVAYLFIDNLGSSEPVKEVSAAEETLPATGNPVMLVLLALISIAGACLGRRF